VAQEKREKKGVALVRVARKEKERPNVLCLLLGVKGKKILKYPPHAA
jgi:hypothetical protein